MKNNLPVFRSLEIIENRISEKLTVAHLADAVYFSKYLYQRLFRETVGESVMVYVTGRRLTLAARALLTTDAPVFDIALRYGYDSHDGFTRSFKARMGVSPSDYRRYGLASIIHATGKERDMTTYTKNTDAILGELNAFIAKARETARKARKPDFPGEDAHDAGFWNLVADRTDELAEEARRALEKVAAIAEYPDTITNRFMILKTIEDAAFMSNILALNVAVTVSRNTTERRDIQWHKCETYRELARFFGEKTNRVAAFMSELAALIFEDMRKAAAEKIRDAAQKGRAAAEKTGARPYYNYIKNELELMADALSAARQTDLTVAFLDDMITKTQIISFSVDTDILRSGGSDKALFDGFMAFADSLRDARDFIQSLPVPADTPEPGRPAAKRFLDIAFQGNILLFYLRGEYDKLAAFADTERRAAYQNIDEKLTACVKLASESMEVTAYGEIADRLGDIAGSLAAEAGELGPHGGVISLLADEVGRLQSAVSRGGRTHGQI